MDVTAFVALLTELDTEDGVLLRRLGPELPEQVKRGRHRSAALLRPRATVYHFPGEQPTARTWRLTGEHVACLVEGAGPAVRVLGLLRRLAPRHAWAYSDGMRGLAAALRDRLGADPAAWRRLQRELPGWAGLLPELVEHAAGARGEPAGTSAIPRPPRAVRLEMRQLLMLLDPGMLAALAPHLHRGTLLDLARFGAPLSPETVAWLVELATPEERLTLAKARWSRPDVAGALAALDDTAINAALYLNPHTSVAVRVRIMAAADRVPLDRSVVDRVRGDAGRSQRLPALYSGDPALVRAALLRRTYTASSVQECLRAWEKDGYVGVAALYEQPMAASEYAPPPFRLPRYRSLLLAAVEGIWRRHGTGEAARLVAELPTMAQRDREHFADLFAAPDGRERLRAEIAAKTTTRALLGRLRGQTVSKLWPLLEVPYADWAAVARAERTAPLSLPAWGLLARIPGCPPREAPEVVDDRGLSAGPGYWPAGPEMHVPREWTPQGYQVAAPARRGCAMPPEHLLTGIAPAAHAFNTYGCLLELTGADRTMLRCHRHLQDLVDRHLGSSAEARVVAMRLLADFPGTAEELLETAGAMAAASG
ncbi:hypothetical protein [Yinghuangia soli]|uniref:Uncharacterized protein n=1 Tax=Yinghuangia soli TaxID=2908204 RepID=A0AA41Q8N0_9ACTN|nr:hypothetical protein [Yinghuangia soli]MCF2533468.1 hypothetical protein [Yinghuangia soli]